MRFNTHYRTTNLKAKKSVKIILTVALGLLIVYVIFLSVVYSVYVSSAEPAVIILAPFLILTVLFLVTQRDMEKAYVEINNDKIRVVDYYLGIKKEKSFSIQDTAHAEIIIGYSMRVHGYRYSMSGCSYIVFRDNGGKYLFKVICVPETKQFFDKYLKLK